MTCKCAKKIVGGKLTNKQYVDMVLLKFRDTKKDLLSLTGFYSQYYSKNYTFNNVSVNQVINQLVDMFKNLKECKMSFKTKVQDDKILVDYKLTAKDFNFIQKSLVTVIDGKITEEHTLQNGGKYHYKIGGSQVGYSVNVAKTIGGQPSFSKYSINSPHVYTGSTFFQKPCQIGGSYRSFVSPIGLTPSCYTGLEWNNNVAGCI